ncbi:MAG: hypothetical protein IKE55_05985 [Kiritimatiellae bacterium]|nr:hypothetical protein [Kiritimatiellia bacterium]
MKKCVYLAVLVAFVLLTVHLVRETRRLRSQVQQLEEERVRAAHAKFVSAWVDITDDEREGMVNIYRSIAQAYTNHDIMAMRIAMLKLPAASDHLSWQLRPLIEKPLTVAFNDNFLRATQLLDFDTSEQLAEFLRTNIELALFFGEVYTRQKRFSMASNMEYLTFLRLRQYKEKFDKDGKDELRNVAAKELEFWTAWIESPKGFTRQFADDVFRSSTEYAEIVKPECALPRDKAMETARKTAEAMLKPTGLTPAWLSEYAVKQQ